MIKFLFLFFLTLIIKNSSAGLLMPNGSYPAANYGVAPYSTTPAVPMQTVTAYQPAYDNYYGSPGILGGFSNSQFFRMPDVIFADPYIVFNYSYVNMQYQSGAESLSGVRKEMPAVFGGGFGLMFNNMSFIEFTVSGGKNQISNNGFITSGTANTVFLRVSIGAQIPLYYRFSLIVSTGFLAHFQTGNYQYSSPTVPAGFSANHMGISPEIGVGFAVGLTPRLILRFEVKNAFLGTDRNYIKNFTTIQTGIVLKI